MPWFWELEGIFDEQLSDEIDFKAMYLWLDKLTAPTFAKQGPFMGIANRRRIWNVCEQIKEHYLKKLDESAGSDDEDGEVDCSILENSRSLQMPLIQHPEQGVGKMMTVQWIRSWDEIDTQSAVFEAFWNKEGYLVGIGVAFGSNRRVLGQKEDEENGIMSRAVRIPTGQWIKEITLHLSNLDVEDKRRRTIKVEALSVRRPL